MLGRIHSVVIWTDDLNRLTPFYRDRLGMKTQMEDAAFVVFEAPGGAPQLALGAHSEVKGASREPNRVMVDFAVDDCQAEYDRLSKAGVEFSRPPSQDPGGVIIATFHDPDGNTLQLFQESAG
jgi:predicted enzyme related to lactoylglutathione lyase